jgi:hypothetical protein
MRGAATQPCLMRLAGGRGVACAELFDFVEVSWQPAKGVHSAAQYSLVADFPKRTYRRDVVSESGATFQDEGMGPQQAFFIAWE